MQKLLAGIAAYGLYYLGDLVSKPMTWPWTGELGGRLYPIYNYLMLKSSDVQEAHGLNGPWHKITGEK